MVSSPTDRLPMGVLDDTIVDRGGRERSHPTMLVVIEPNDPDAGALAAAAWLVRRLDARAVVTAFVQREASLDELDRTHIRLAQERVARATRGLARQGITTDRRVIVGGPHHRLRDVASDFADEIDPALICVLAAHRSRLWFLPGSPLAHHLQRVGTWPVVAMPPRKTRRRGQ